MKLTPSYIELLCMADQEELIAMIIQKDKQLQQLRRLCAKSPRPIFGKDGNILPAFDKWLEKIAAAGQKKG